jgi:hypothetical protein
MVIHHANLLQTAIGQGKQLFVGLTFGYLTS